MASISGCAAVPLSIASLEKVQPSARYCYLALCLISRPISSVHVCDIVFSVVYAFSFTLVCGECQLRVLDVDWGFGNVGNNLLIICLLFPYVKRNWNVYLFKAHRVL